jgi:hypothetical protein
MFESDAEGCANPTDSLPASPQNALNKPSKIFLKAVFGGATAESQLRLWTISLENSGTRPLA